MLSRSLICFYYLLLIILPLLFFRPISCQIGFILTLKTDDPMTHQTDGLGRSVQGCLGLRADESCREPAEGGGREPGWKLGKEQSSQVQD